jgi:hypothetical protein
MIKKFISAGTTPYLVHGTTLDFLIFLKVGRTRYQMFPENF